jgi:DNA-binding NarL/FixJ family response regulator
MVNRARVMVLEDDAEVRREIVATIDRDRELQVVGQAGSLEAARQSWRSWAPALAVIDLQLTDGDATELIPELRASGVASLVLTVSDTEARVFAALSAGAGGYLLKAEALATVGDSLRSLRDGGAPVSPRIARRLLDDFQRRAVAPSPSDDAVDQLTARERDVIEGFARGATYREVASALGMSANTVRHHVRNIYDKLHVGSKTEAVLRAMAKKPKGHGQAE